MKKIHRSGNLILLFISILRKLGRNKIFNLYMHYLFLKTELTIDIQIKGNCFLFLMSNDFIDLFSARGYDSELDMTKVINKENIFEYQ